MKKYLEICVENLQSALYAETNGADRIELCDNLFQGGITPSAGKMKLAVEKLTIPVFVLIRPRKADFLYSELEFELMLEDIALAKSFGVGGIVSGILTAGGDIDLKRMRQLVEASAPLPFTCHRAFDMCRDPMLAIDQLAELGVQRILTSGQQPTAQLGSDTIRKSVEKADGRLQIMACGALLPDNIDHLLAIDGLLEFHAAVKMNVQSKMQFMGHTPMGEEAVADEFQWSQANPALIQGLSQKIHA